MGDIENKTIKQRIDKNSDHMTDYVEIMDFILEDKNQSKNIRDLGNYLSNLGYRLYDEIRQQLNLVMLDPEILKLWSSITDKVRKNEDLTDDEKSILYLQAVMSKSLNNRDFDLKQPIEKICKGELLYYIQKNYNNYGYNPNKGKEDRSPRVDNLKRPTSNKNPNIPSSFLNNNPPELDKKQLKYQYDGIETISDDIKLSYSKLDKKSKTYQQYLTIGQQTCNKIINELKGHTDDSWALEPLTELSTNITNNANLLDTLKRAKDDQRKIDFVAKIILDAQNEVLKRIAKNETIKESERIAEQSGENGKKMFNIQDDGSLVFTKESNPVKIQQALAGLFNDPNIVYQIDYSGINTTDKQGVGQRIKDNAQKYIGGQKCYLSYNENTKTYNLRDSEGNQINYRARIREGVKLIPDGIIKWNAYQEQKKLNEKSTQFDGLDISDQLRQMNIDMPSSKKLYNDERKDLLIKTENRIIKLLKEAKSQGYEIDMHECTTKLWLSRGMMELHLINRQGQKTDWKIREDDKILGADLYKYIDGHEGEYKAYLANRILQRRGELDHLTKYNKIDLSGNDIISETEKNQLLNGMSMLKVMLDTERKSSSSTLLVGLCCLLGDGIYSIENSTSISRDKVKKLIIDRGRSMYEGYKGLSPTRSLDPSTSLTTENYAYTQAKENFYQAFWGGEHGQIYAIRNISAVSGGAPGGFGLDKTSSSEVVENKIIDGLFEKDDSEIYKHKFQVKNDKENECIKKIGSRVVEKR